MNVLITGGAGFIGTHLSRHLLCDGHTVTVLDNFSEQIHGTNVDLAEDLRADVRLIRGDIRDRDALASAIAGQDAIVHLAAETGTGQSMYEVRRYEDVNIGGTALLLDLLVNDKARTAQCLIVASSRATYGEGKCECPTHGVVYPQLRSSEAMRSGRFEPLCPLCGADTRPLATDENSPFQATSFYGLTKQVQEQMVLLFGRTLGIRSYALRYQNVYGPGQSLKNPYTGILAIFSTQARANKPIYIFEDGEESRDFVYIEDVVDATVACFKAKQCGMPLNVGSGQRTTVREVVSEITSYFGSQSQVSVTGSFREGDIRHNLADLTRATQVLGFTPRWNFHDGIRSFLEWASGQDASATRYEESLQEMRERGLYHAQGS